MTDPTNSCATRRAASLDAALAAVRGRRRRRGAGRTLAVATLLLLVVTAAWPRDPILRPDEPRTAAHEPPERPTLRIVRVDDDPGITARLAATTGDVSRWIVPATTASTVERLDDHGLGTWLRRAGRRPGRIHVGDRTLVPAVATE